MNDADDTMPTRRSLLARLKNWDDRESWKTFFDTYWKLIYGVALKAGLSHTEAEEVVQETIVAVASKMREFRYDPALGSFKGWLHHLTRWRIADQWRKRRRADPLAEASEEGDVLEQVADPASFALDLIWEDEWRKNLMDAALRRIRRRVNPQDYQMFDFYVVKEWPVKTVASTLQVSVARVYQAKSRILPVLRRELEQLQSDML